MKSGTWVMSPRKSRTPFSEGDDWSDGSDDDTDNETEEVKVISLDSINDEIKILSDEAFLSSGTSDELPNVAGSMGIRQRRNRNYLNMQHTSPTLCVDTSLNNETDVKDGQDTAKELVSKSEDVVVSSVETTSLEKSVPETMTSSTAAGASATSSKTLTSAKSRSSVKADATPAQTPPATPTPPRCRPPPRRSLSRQQSMTASNRLEVGVKMKVKLEYIDDVSHEMNALVYLSLHYEDEVALKFITNSPGFCALDPEKEGIFVPVVNFLNTRVCDHIEGFRVLVNTSSGTVFIYRIYRVVFRNIMNLKRFPFDRQVMKCHIKSFTAMLKPWHCAPETIPSGITSDPMWKDNDCVVECDCTLWNVSWVTALAESSSQPSVYKLNFGISRKSLFYVVNFFLITFLVVIATISCTIIHFTDFGSRSSITFTILLTLISFKFIMANYTPTINYLVSYFVTVFSPFNHLFFKFLKSWIIFLVCSSMRGTSGRRCLTTTISWVPFLLSW
mmetsp:Transcript_20118/g.33889  ORF Transcript_20118/g.33889 Transcript_20118/m.33889 type:complete len:503 (-) Transcript_20118:638-2146(-)